MSIRYIKPLGEELQHQISENSVCLHSDVFLLFNIANLSVAERVADDVLSRFKPYPEKASFDEFISKSTDNTVCSDTLDYTSRYDSTLNAQRSRVLSKLQKLDEYEKSLKDKKQSAKLKLMRERMQKYFEDQFGITDDPDNSNPVKS